MVHYMHYFRKMLLCFPNPFRSQSQSVRAQSCHVSRPAVHQRQKLFQQDEGKTLKISAAQIISAELPVDLVTDVLHTDPSPSCWIRDISLQAILQWLEGQIWDHRPHKGLHYWSHCQNRAGALWRLLPALQHRHGCSARHGGWWQGQGPGRTGDSGPGLVFTLGEGAVANQNVSWLPDLACWRRRPGWSGTCPLRSLLWWRLLHHPLQLHTGTRAAHYLHLVRKRLMLANLLQPCEVFCPQKKQHLVEDCVPVPGRGWSALRMSWQPLRSSQWSWTTQWEDPQFRLQLDATYFVVLQY